MAVLYLKGISNELKAQFKAHCAKRQKTMHETVVQFMKDSIRETKSLNPKEKK